MYARIRARTRICARIHTRGEATEATNFNQSGENRSEPLNTNSDETSHENKNQRSVQYLHRRMGFIVQRDHKGIRIDSMYGKRFFNTAIYETLRK